MLENIQKVVDKFNFLNEEDMYVVVGYNGIIVLQVVNCLMEKERKQCDQEEQEKIV